MRATRVFSAFALAAASPLVAISVTLLFGYALLRLSALPAAQSSAEPTSSGMIPAFELQGPTYDLAYDARRETLWWTVMSPAGEDDLFAYDLGRGSVDKWTLPETTHNGFLERVAVAPDGSVWMTEEYSIVRFDPTQGHMKSVTLAADDQDASADALNPDGLSPGTWPTAIVFVGRNAIIGRHNLNALTVMDASLGEAGRISLPSEMHGVSALAVFADGEIAATSYAQHMTVVVGADGKPVATMPIGFGAVAAVGNHIWTAESGQVDMSTNASGLVDGSPNDLVATNGQTTAVFTFGRSLLEWFDVTGKLVRSLPLPSVSVEVPNPDGQLVSAQVSANLTAMAVDGTGTTWVVVAGDGSGELMRIAP